MMKSILLFFILSIASILAEQTICTQLYCVKRGDQCGYVNTRDKIISTQCQSQDDGCYLENGTEADDDYNTGKCQMRPGSNQTCGGDTGLACGTGFSCEYDSSSFFGAYRCQAITRETEPGYPCTANSECSWSSSDFPPVTEKTCTNGACKFTADGQPCSSTNQCNQFTNSVCNTSAVNPTCYRRASLQLGATCDLQSSLLSCEGGHLDCIPNGVNTTVGTCGYYYSQTEGEACISDSHCAKGYCNGAASTLVRYGQCVEFKKTPTLNKECIDDNYCSTGNGESCRCFGEEQPKCMVSDVDEDYSKKYEVANTCVSSFSTVGKCQYTNDDGECYIDSCKKQICDYYKEFKKDTDHDVYGIWGIQPCVLRQACDASAIFASLSFSLLAVVFVLFF